MNKVEPKYHSTYRSKSIRNARKRRKKVIRNLSSVMVVFVLIAAIFSKGTVGRFLLIFSIELAAAAALVGLASYLSSAKKNSSKRVPESLVKGHKEVNAYTEIRTREVPYSSKNRKKSNFDWVLEKKDKNTAAVKSKEEHKDIGAKKEVTEERKFIPYRSPFEPINPVNKAPEQAPQETETEIAGKECDGQAAGEDLSGCADEKPDFSADSMDNDAVSDMESNISIMFDGETTDCIEENEDAACESTESLPEYTGDENAVVADIEEEAAADCQETAEICEEPDDIQEPLLLPEDRNNDVKPKVIRLIKKAKGTVTLKGSVEKHESPVSRHKTDIQLPSTGLLTKHEETGRDVALIPEGDHNARKLVETLASFGVGAKVVNVSKGPTVTRYELQPNIGVKVSKIVNLADDIALNLAATAVRIEAPIPGKAAVGIEIPNKEVTSVLLRDVLESEEFLKHPSKLAFAVGKDISGSTVVADIAKMPHLLIAGATGSGKSVCINTLIASILYKATPSEVKLLMIDPKVVELNIYNGIPHLLVPVVTDPKKAAGALNWAIQEMVNRYKLFADNSVRDLKGYNSLIRNKGEGGELPHIVIIIDELADLMMVAPNDVEDCICRLAQMARAAGMHLVIATQRPSVDIITGVIKANIPSRISFAVTSQVDSRTILDMAGAEKLLGRGDMLFNPIGEPKPKRVQGAFISDREVEAIVEHLKATSTVEYDEEIMQKIDKTAEPSQPDSDGDDELLQQAIEMVIDCGQASSSLIQRKFKVGYARAARIVDQMEAWGVVSSSDGSKPRKILVTKQEWEDLNA